MEHVRWFSLEPAPNGPGFHLVIAKDTGELRRFWMNGVTLNLIAARIRVASPQWNGDGRHETPKQGFRPTEIEERNVAVSVHVEADDDALRLSLESERGADRSEWTAAQGLALLRSIEAALAAAGVTR